MIPLSGEPKPLKDTFDNRFYEVNEYIIYKVIDYSNSMGLLYLFYCLTSYRQREAEQEPNMVGRLVSSHVSVLQDKERAESSEQLEYNRRKKGRSTKVQSDDNES